jgi:hypothetical protein
MYFYSIVSIALFLLSGSVTFTGEAAVTAPHESPGLSGVTHERIYLAADITDNDEEANIDDPGEEATVGDPGQSATVGDPGERTRIGDPGQQATVGDPGESSTIGDPGEKSSF